MERCNQCQLENNIGLCDRKDCSNNQDYFPSVKKEIDINTILEVFRKQLEKHNYSPQVLEETVELLRPVLIWAESKEKESEEFNKRFAISDATSKLQ